MQTTPERAKALPSVTGASLPPSTKPPPWMKTITGAAPMTAMIVNVPLVVGNGNGYGAAAAFLVATAILVIFSVGYAAMARKVSKMSVLLLLPPMMNSTLLCLSQCLKQMLATDFIFS